MMAKELVDYDECDSCGEFVGCTWMNKPEEDPCCDCARIDTHKRCDWCRQDYIDSMAE